MPALPVTAAAAALAVSPATLRRWMREGCPVARRGRRGRGCKALIDPAAVTAWRASDGTPEAFVRDLAGRLPELVAAAMEEAHRHSPDKRGAAWTAVAGWQLVVGALVDTLREHVPDLPDPEIPEAIATLRKIARR